MIVSNITEGKSTRNLHIEKKMNKLDKVGCKKVGIELSSRLDSSLKRHGQSICGLRHRLEIHPF